MKRVFSYLLTDRTVGLKWFSLFTDLRPFVLEAGGFGEDGLGPRFWLCPSPIGGLLLVHQSQADHWANGKARLERR